MALGVHALHISDVVALLHRRLRGVGTTRANGGATKEATAGADGRAGGWAACRGADRGTGYRPNNGSDGGAADGALADRALGGRSRLLRRPLAAKRVVGLELFEALAVPRQHHHTWS